MVRRITLLTDFGTADTYVAEMKGVICTLAPDAAIVDLTHDVPPRDVVAGALALARVVPLFPEGTIHVAVVDPGVGTPRRAVIVRTSRSWLVGPDNGVLALAARGEGTVQAVAITNPALARPVVSRTFHGRDVFAPAAAHLARGVPPSEFGPAIADLAELDLPAPIVDGDRLVGEVVAVDRFGNAITNISEAALAAFAGDRAVVATAGASPPARRVGTYGDARTGEAIALVGGGGFLELAVRDGDAARAFGLAPNTKFVVTRVGDR
jgi:S-adenosylmethionine hydrolase